MLDFTYNVPTKILFGRGQIHQLTEEVEKYATQVLFVYGGGSIKKIGVYDSIIDILEKSDIEFVELSGVQPNPRIESVRKGIMLCKDHHLDFILGVGGGSVIDCAKTIAAGMFYEGDPWDLFLLGDSAIRNALPLGTVLTCTGSGSEMNGNAVISNTETEEKLAIHKDVLRPRFSILDPTYTFTVPKEQTAAGTVDIFSHVLEQYFSPTQETFLQDRLSEGILNTCIHYGPIALNEPTNYTARAHLMWASSIALNGLLGYGKITDWATHGIEHAVSASYDITHGIGLAILTPYWMEYVLDNETLGRFVNYARNVWSVDETNDFEAAKKGIEKTREFFSSLGMPKTLQEVGVHEQKLNDMAERIVSHGDVGKFKKLGKRDVLTILHNAFS
jgi:alcohol dehydrogenase YqhD (iron-dependent ADH family)